MTNTKISVLPKSGDDVIVFDAETINENYITTRYNEFKLSLKKGTVGTQYFAKLSQFSMMIL